MTAGKPYQRSHAEALLKPVDDGENWVIDDLGVWPAADFNEFDALGGRPEYNVLSWKPVMVFKDDRPAPDCKNTPALPFPFDAGDLAAFMLEGTGSSVAEHYGSWGYGPDEEVLDEIDPGDNYARQAVRDAYEAYRTAIQKVGEFESELQSRADALREEYQEEQRKAKKKANLKDLPHVSVDGGEAYRRAREQALEPLAGKKAALELARADAEGAHQRWLRAMVEELEKANSDTAPNPSQGFEAPPVMTGRTSSRNAIDFARLATRDQLINAFGTFTGMNASWFKNLKDTPALRAARKVTGQGGRGHIAEPLFCPFEVMQWLVNPRRRMGRKLGIEKAWELLEKHFPKVHCTHSVADPRELD